MSTCSPTSEAKIPKNVGLRHAPSNTSKRSFTFRQFIWLTSCIHTNALNTSRRRPDARSANTTVSWYAACEAMCARMRLVTMGASTSTGGFLKSSSVGASVASARPPSESIRRFTQSIWTALRGDSPTTSALATATVTAETFRGDLKREKFLDTLEGVAAPPNRGDGAGEGIVEEENIRRVLGDVRPGLAHRETDVRGFQRRRVVGPVARHGDHFSSPSRRLL